MDHNLGLLKSQQHHANGKFLECMLDHNMLPAITRPSRITQTSATLIDNIFISSFLQQSFDSCLLLNDTTDHLPTLLLAKQIKLADKEPLEFESRRQNNSKTQITKKNLQDIDWIGHLNSNNSNHNFNVFCDLLKGVMDNVAPEVTVRIKLIYQDRMSKPKLPIIICPWIT